MNTDRFANLDLDPAPAGIDAAAPAVQPESTRWTHPEVEGVELPVFDNFENGTSFSDYVVSSGPAGRAIVEKGLHYPILLEPIALASGQYCPNLDDHFAVIDSRTWRRLGRIVRGGYSIAQTTTVGAMIDSIVPEDAEVELFSWNGGERIAFRVPLDTLKGQIDNDLFDPNQGTRKNGYMRWFDRQSSTALDGRWYLIVSNGHGGYEKLRAQLERRVFQCSNGQVTDLIKGGFAFTHTARLNERLEQAQRAFQLAARSAQEYTELFSRMFGQTLDATQFTECMDLLFPETQAVKEKERTRANWTENRARFQKVYHEAPGAAPGTVLGAMNATTYWLTHEAKVGVTGATADETFADGLVGPAAVEVRAPARRYELQLFGRNTQDTSDRVLNWCRLQLN